MKVEFKTLVNVRDNVSELKETLEKMGASYAKSEFSDEESLYLHYVAKKILEQELIHITIKSDSQLSFQYRVTTVDQKLEDGIFGEDFYSEEQALCYALIDAIGLIGYELPEDVKSDYNDREFMCKVRKIQARAEQVHKDVNQHYDDYDYSYHLNGVADKTLYYLYRSEIPESDWPYIMFGAYFHDAIEDARLTYNDVMKIEKELLPETDGLGTEIVYALTCTKGKNRAEREGDEYFAGIRDTKYASLVKCSDRFANINYSLRTSSSMYKKYISELPNFILKVFPKKDEDGKLDGLYDLIREELLYLAPSKGKDNAIFDAFN